jgi:uncharacterized BrkB/YihY/UPF0761 family membrane protein
VRAARRPAEVHGLVLCRQRQLRGHARLGVGARASGWLIAFPIWIGGSLVFWLWTPRYLLHRKVSLRSLLPGALLATFVLSGTIATSPLWIGPTINQDARAFGAFGAVIALFAYILIGTTLSMVCAVFAPVWAEWREGEKDRNEQGAAPTDVTSEPAALPDTG